MKKWTAFGTTLNEPDITYLQQPTTFARFIRKNFYLPVVAAWLITFSFIIDNYWSGNSSVEAVKKNIAAYIHTQENAFEKLVSDSSAINKLSSGKYSLEQLEQLAAGKFFFYIYFTNDIGIRNTVFWSSQTVIPADYIFTSPQTSGFTQLPNGYYVWRKKIQESKTYLALIPVKWNYIVTNEYLQNSFVTGDNIENSYDIAETGNNKVTSIDGNTLFSVIQKSVVSIKKNNIVAAWLKVMAAICLLIFIHLLAHFLVIKKRFSTGVVFLGLSIVLLRALSYYFPVPLNFRQFELFDPAIYGSNVVLRSLGDVLINALLFVWFVLFVRRHWYEKSIQPHVKNKLIAGLIYTVCILALIAATFASGHVVRTLVTDSQISFDVINFFTLNIYSVIGFAVLCCLFIGYFFISQVLLQIIQAMYRLPAFVLYLSIAVAGLLLLSIRLNSADTEFELYMLLWLLLYVLLLGSKMLTIFATRIISSRLVFWLFFFSVSITAVIVIENKKKELRNRQHYAETLASKVDPSSETLMNTLLTGFRNDFLAANFQRFSSDSAASQLKDSLVNGNFSGYTNKYDTKIFVYDSIETGINNIDSTAYNTLNTVLTAQAKPTGIADLYYYDESFDRFSYIAKKTVTDTSGKTLGYVFILASPKTAKTDAPYPELFSRGTKNSIESSPVYAFAVYNKLQLINSHNDYAFSTTITTEQVPKEEYNSITKKGYDELWYKAGPDKVVIIAKENNSLIESITLFSYLFCAFLLVTGIFWLINFLLQAGTGNQNWQGLKQLSIRNQIHGTVIFISVLSFIIIGVGTILFFISRYQNSNREKLSRTIHVMEKEVRNSFTEIAMFDDVVKIYDSAYRQKLEQTIAKISEIHAADINVYDIDGNLQASSLPLPYSKGIVSTRMDPVAFYHLNKLKEVQYFKEEKIGSLRFTSNYVPVIDETGREYAYLNIPYFTSESRLRQEISNFLVTIINLNAFIFLIAGIIALFITNRITQSFSFISNKMKEVNLGKMNEPIEWKRKDEIGQLVAEYNKMVSKLDASAAALAKSERESAWREMARQVAHEIKNPLTPMKLSLQYLQKAIDENSPAAKTLSTTVAKTLVEQIDHLSQIAGEFSQFANIGNPNNEVIEINSIIRTVVQLYSNTENFTITYTGLSQPVKVYGDKTHINRLITNLLQNAVQAVPATKRAEIKVDESLHNNNIIITVTDNGSGIPQDVQAQIFTPNFTTKTSGTGLGLAMCKGIVEQAKGKIWFTTIPGKGTSFFVELPLAE